MHVHIKEQEIDGHLMEVTLTVVITEIHMLQVVVGH